MVSDFRPAKIRASGPFFQNHPCFGFSRVARRDQFLIGIGWMDLNGERLSHIEKFQQQRKPGVVRRELAKDMFRRLLEQMPEGTTFEQSVRDNAGVTLAVAPLSTQASPIGS